MKRREFIQNSGLGLGMLMLSPEISELFKNEKITTGIQLYSVREAMKSNPLATLTALRKMGYTVVEHANYVDHKFYGWTPTEFKKVLNDLGMVMPTGHTVLRSTHWDDKTKDFNDDWKKLVDNAAFMGQKYVISPSMEKAWRNDYDTLMKVLDIFNKSGELCAKNGMQFGYHNHEFEFSEKLNGETLWDIMNKNTDPASVSMQLDVGNMYIAGAKAKDIIAKYPGRYLNIHVKDQIAGQKEGSFESCVLGQGILPMKEIIDLAKANGANLFIIEQEAYQGKDPVSCMQENFTAMKKWKYIQ
jgi:sugar phosphate isomerase/epimerase